MPDGRAPACSLLRLFATAPTMFNAMPNVELTGRQRQDARPGPQTMYRVPADRAWWPAVGAPVERRVRPHCRAEQREQEPICARPDRRQFVVHEGLDVRSATVPVLRAIVFVRCTCALPLGSCFQLVRCMLRELIDGLKSLQAYSGARTTLLPFLQRLAPREDSSPTVHSPSCHWPEADRERNHARSSLARPAAE
jgi:hypothetical protein